MKQRLYFVIAAVAVAIAVGGGLAYAQTASVDIGFKFMAGGKAMPAGKYTIEKTPNGPLALKSQAPTVASVFLPEITRLGRHDNDAEPELVFDNIKGELQLSEVWFPGEDGYLLLGTKERHDHRVVGGPKSWK
jgi:hypothetical protein